MTNLMHAKAENHRVATGSCSPLWQPSGSASWIVLMRELVAVWQRMKFTISLASFSQERERQSIFHKQVKSVCSASSIQETRSSRLQDRPRTFDVGSIVSGHRNDLVLVNFTFNLVYNFCDHRCHVSARICIFACNPTGHNNGRISGATTIKLMRLSRLGFDHPLNTSAT
jgi:hypothetical protein